MIDFPFPPQNTKTLNVGCWMLECWNVGLKNLYVQSYKFISL